MNSCRDQLCVETGEGECQPPPPTPHTPYPPIPHASHPCSPLASAPSPCSTYLDVARESSVGCLVSSRVLITVADCTEVAECTEVAVELDLDLRPREMRRLGAGAEVSTAHGGECVKVKACTHVARQRQRLSLQTNNSGTQPPNHPHPPPPCILERNTATITHL